MEQSQATSSASGQEAQRSHGKSACIQSAEELSEENKKLRRLQLMMNMVLSVLSQSPDLTVEQASEMVANSRRAALAMFPDKELAFNLLWKPRLQRVMTERFRIQ
jgi:hypothetical protein